jgi:hypothetical protein
MDYCKLLKTLLEDMDEEDSMFCPNDLACDDCDFKQIIKS